jgi:hypothetical protein
MKYPTIEEVEKASHIQICKWYRFLPSPGTQAIGTKYFDEVLIEETEIMNKITKRLSNFGGFTPEISKQIGWEL